MNEETVYEAARRPSGDDSHSPGIHVHRRQAPKRAIGALLVLLLLVNLATSLYFLPVNRLIESKLCQEYYDNHEPSTVINPDGSINEELCKVDEVQQSLAWIVGFSETLWIVGDFVMTIPLGFLAEKYGRKAIICLNLISRLFMLSWALIVAYCELPVRAVIAGHSLSVLGGDCVFQSLSYALAASLSDDNVIRASYFSWMASSQYVVSVSAPALASATMTISLDLPFWIGIVLLSLAVPTIRMLPSEDVAATALEDEQRRPLISSPTLKAQASNASLLTPILERFRTLAGAFKSHPRNLLLLLISFFLTALASSDTKLLAQYISKRYSWKLAWAGYLLSGKAIINFILLTFLIPALLQGSSSTREQSQSSSDRANIRFSRICLVVSVLGALAIAVAREVWLLFPSLLLYALGSALPVFTLSLLKSPSISQTKDEEPAGPETHLFSIVFLVKTLGSLCGAPLMASLWISGIQVGELGIPYFVSAACYLAAIGVFSGIKV